MTRRAADWELLATADWEADLLAGRLPTVADRAALSEPEKPQQGCAYHKACAYPVPSPERCDRCHRDWSVIAGRDEQLAAYHSRNTKKPFSPRPEGIVRALHRQSHGSTGTPRPGA